VDFAPPACAIEDLVTLSQGTLAALRAQRQLTDLVRQAVAQQRAPLVDDEHGDLAETIYSRAIRARERPG
jgi:hypothetical protein